jgi:Fur family ferric uptake transcriptional regulator
MTLAPRRTRLPFSDLDDVAAAIRDGGGRLSSSRRIVLAALFAADGPVSAEYIADGLGGQVMASDVSSVYRNLEHLEELGVVRHVHLGHGPGLYTLDNDTQREYLVCERCDRVDSVDAARLDPIRDAIQDAFGYQARFSHFPIVGLCAHCADSDDIAQGPRATADPQADLEHRHSHQHHHGDVSHDHRHTEHAHDHVEHVHEHNHGDRVHAHDHVHQQHLEDDHRHSH